MTRILFLLLILSLPCFALDQIYDTKGLFLSVEEEILSIRQGDFFHAYSSLTTKEFKAHTCFDDFLLFISKIPALYNNSSFHLGMAKVDDKGGIFEGEIEGKGGEKMAIHIDLKKGIQRWLIESMVVYPLVKK